VNVAAILLAAGSATRFGSDKLLHPLPHGVPIAVQAARNLKQAIGRVVAVLRPGAAQLQRLLEEEGVEVVSCERALEGMGASLACAVRAAGAVDGYLVALADMPFVRPSTIVAVRDALAAGAPLAAPYFRARRGHPVAIGAEYRRALEALEGDEGARRLFAADPGKVAKIAVGDPGVLRDIDTPADLAPPVIV